MMKCKKITIFLVLIIFLNTIFLTNIMVFADKSTKLEKTENVIDESNKAEVIVKAFKACYSGDLVKAYDPEGEKGLKFFPWTSLKSVKDNKNNLFSNDKIVYVGNSLEKNMGGAGPWDWFKDGKISCKDGGGQNITVKFMTQFNLLLEDLFCRPNGKNGLLAPANKDRKCTDVKTDYDLGFYKNIEDGESYIDEIYQGWINKNKAISINNDETKTYLSALEVFEGNCMDTPIEYLQDETGDTYDFTIRKLDTGTGEARDLYPKTKEGKPFGKSGKEANFDYSYKINGQVVRNCKEAADLINENYDKYAKTVEVTKESVYPDPCTTPELIKRATDIISMYDRRAAFPAGATKAEQDEYDLLSNALKTKEFSVDNGKGGKKCLETMRLKVCNTEKMMSKAQSILQQYDFDTEINSKQMTDAEKEEYRILSEALKKKDFTIDDGSGGKKCIETENFNNFTEPEDDSESDTSSEQKQSYCQENGGFLSWMLCPTIADGAATASGLLGAITDLTATHKSIIEQFSDQGSAIYKAWSAFRNLANIGFVIMLLVVIFSQVTSIGISNYNIKKILPKLIITAILVNFSYLILGVLIDLSHIIGNGIGSAIRTIAGESMSAEASAQASNTISTIAGAVAGAGVIGGGVAIATTGPAIILPVVLFIITTVISVFFGFVMLTIRQAAIIMVIVLAPLAMVLYALPNTAAITKKYVSTLKALLMLYPMFVLATSAGALASSIIVGTSTDFLMMIVGGLLNVLPYFAIPSMTSKSLAGLGAITSGFDKIRGGALKGVGMAGGAIAASEFYKNMKSDFNSDKNLNRSLSRLRKYKAIEDAGGTLSTSQRRRQTEAAGAVLKDAKMRAGGSAAAGIALSNYEGSGFAGLQAAAQNELMDSEDKNNMMLFANEGYTPDQMVAMLQDASKADYGLMNDDQKRANDSRIRALTKSLMSTKAGQKAFEKQIASNKDMEISNRAFGQMAHAALQTPGLADKYQVMNNQFGNYINKGGDMKGEEVKSGLMGGTYERGMVSTLGDLNAEKLQKISKFEVQKLEESGLDTTNLQAAFNQLGAASLKDPSLIADFDGIKQERVLEAQKSYLEESQKTTINVRGGGTADVYSAPADFGEIASQKVVNGDVVYTNKNGDTFNASKNQTTKNL